jgi:hypothetical protein
MVMETVSLEDSNTVPVETFMQEVRSWVGTPYRDKGRKKGVGCDCIGLPLVSAVNVGLAKGDIWAYSPTPKDRRVEVLSDKYMVPLHEGETLQRGASEDPARFLPIGSVGLFWFLDRGEPQHFAVFGRHPLDHDTVTMIHAHQQVGKVVEASLSPFWTKRLVKVYLVRGVIYPEQG